MARSRSSSRPIAIQWSRGPGERSAIAAGRLVKDELKRACEPCLQCVDANFPVTLPDRGRPLPRIARPPPRPAGRDCCQRAIPCCRDCHHARAARGWTGRHRSPAAQHPSFRKRARGAGFHPRGASIRLLLHRSRCGWTRRSGKSSGNAPASGRYAAVAPIEIGLDLLDLHFQQIAGLGTFDFDRPGQDARPHPRQSRRVDRGERIGNTKRTGGSGITSGPPETQATTTWSPDATVSTGGNAASKIPKRTVSGAEFREWVLSHAAHDP